ncbi:MAG: hypothetical protein ACRDSJ_15190 [Rubrobacteraceae bacterium]
MKTLIGKTMWLGRATVFLVGLAVILAAVFGAASMALAANGKPFLLGKSNVATKVSKLVKDGVGPALDLRVDSGAPLAVNSAEKVENLNADTLDGTDSPDILRRGSAFNPPTELGLNFHSYFMNTSTAGSFPFGQVKIETTGTPGQFKVCEDVSATSGTFNFVAYVNGTRTSGSFAVNGGCSQIFDAGAGGDFQVSIRRTQIFGVHSGDGTTNENYSLIGFTQL